MTSPNFLSKKLINYWSEHQKYFVPPTEPKKEGKKKENRLRSSIGQRVAQRASINAVWVFSDEHGRPPTSIGGS